MVNDGKVPGLKGIVENEDGTFDLEVDDGMEEQFFDAFGLKPGDEEGLREVITRALESFMKEKRNESGT